MSYKPGDAYYAEFTTQRFDTGAATNADTLPSATANRNGTDDAAFTLTVANLDTGRYKISGIIPSGYAAGDSVTITAAATVNSVSGKGVVDSFVLDGKRIADISSGSGVVVTTNNDKSSYGLSAVSIQAIWDALTSALATTGSIGKLIVDNLNAAISSRLAASAYASPDNAGIGTLLARIPGTVQPQTGDSYARIGAPATGSVTSDIAAQTTTINEISGLLGKAVGLRNTAYSGSNLVSYDLCLYDNNANATANDGATGLLHRYQVSNSYDGSGNLIGSVTTRVS